MKLHLPRVCLVGFASGVCAVAFAQSDIPIEYLKPLNNSFSFGIRATGHGVKVKFGNLGSVPAVNFDDILANKGVTRVYDDGQVIADAVRLDDPSIDGSTSKDLGNGHYQTIGASARVSADGTTVTETADDGTVTTPTFATITGIYLSYQANQTREWSYTNSSQATEVPGSIAMHSYSSTSNGASTTAEGGSGGGIEMEVGHTFGRIGNRMEWGVMFSFGLNDISVKSTSTVQATLHTLTDVYSLQGATAPAAPYTSVGLADSSEFTNTYQDTGETVNAVTDATTTPVTVIPVTTPTGQENTTPLAQEPTSRTETDTANAATVVGHWQIKGAYYIAKAGPTLRFNFTPKFAVSASAGAAFAYISTKYRVDETLTLPGLANVAGFSVESFPERKLKPGYYGNFNAEYWVTPRTGFYGGVMYEKVGAFDQTFIGRTAHIDIGGGLGFRFGMTTRF